MTTRRRKPLVRATTLDGVYLALSPEPLTDPAEIDQFYHEDFNRTRASFWRDALVSKIRQSHGADYFKGVLTGHPGVGKSTELAVLGRELSDKFLVVPFNALKDLNPQQFDAVDTVFAITARVIEETAKVGPFNIQTVLLNDLAEAAAEYLPFNAPTKQEKSTNGADLSVGLPDWLPQLKLAISTKTETTQEPALRRWTFGQLQNLLNRILKACQDNLQGRDLLLAAETSTKIRSPPASSRRSLSKTVPYC